jgi:hypothetical protein
MNYFVTNTKSRAIRFEYHPANAIATRRLGSRCKPSTPPSSRWTTPICPARPVTARWPRKPSTTCSAESGARKPVHLCFGNYGGQTIQKGFFRELLPFFNGLACDHLVLEFARRGYDELEVFRNLKPSIALGPCISKTGRNLTAAFQRPTRTLMES